ncbi:MAG: hypothetical protein IKW91_05080 [Bacteroidaceae bacterium]|nr:hypothetical protein [Bacteroidaceae bacterium]
MKKKLIQLLMLLVAAVSVGSFVSCKDTNEDLYNELRAKSIADDATLREALEARIAELEAMIAAINSCECDTALMLSWVNSEDQYLQEQINNINAALTEFAKIKDVYTKTEIDQMLHDINDVIEDIKLQYATKEELVRLVERVGQLEYLKEQVAILEEALLKMKSCECDCATIMSKLGALEADMAEVKAKVNQALEGLKQVEDLAEAAKTAADQAATAAENAKSLAETAQNTANEAKTLAEILKGLYETAANNATDAKTIATEAKTMAENNKEAITTLTTKVNELDGKVTLATTTANSALEKAAEALAKAELIDALTTRVAVNESEIANLKEKVATMEKLAEQVGANTEAITELKEKVSKVDELAERLAKLEGEFECCHSWCEEAIAAAKAEVMLEIEKLKSELVDRIATNEEAIRLHEKALEQLADMIKDFVTKEELQEQIERIDALEAADIVFDERLTNVETTIGELKPIVEKLVTDVSAIDERLTTAEEKLNEIYPEVKELLEDVEAIQEYLRSQVTGLIVQGTYNPMFGSVTIPANIQTNVLVAYYGKPATNVEFPTTDDANYVRKKEVLTAKDWEMIEGVEVFEQKANKTLLNEDENGNANAGKVYVTVNPTSFDATDLELQIVNTQDEVSPITLSPLKKSDATLQFGFTRADNGFYEADASIKKSDLSKLEFALNEQTLIDAIQQIREKLAKVADNFINSTGDSGDLGGLATKVYNVIHEMRTDQQGLKCPYKDIDGNDAAIYSQYNLATTVIRPLNLATFKDVHYYTIPGYEDVEDFLDDIAATLKDHVHFIFQEANGSWKIQELFNGLQIDGISLVDYTSNMLAKLEIQTSSFTINGVKFNMENYNDGRCWLKFDKDLTINGTKVTVPEAIRYDSDEVNINKTTLVIQNNPDDPSKLQGVIVVRAQDSTGEKTAYVTISLVESTLKAEVVSGTLRLTTEEDTYDVATISGSNLTPTATQYIYLHKILGQGKVHVPFVKEIIGDAQKIVDELSQLTFELTETLGKINAYEGVVNGWIDDLMDEYLKKYLNKINHTTCYFFNSVNRRFGPFLCASNDYKGFKRLSTSKYFPTELDKEGLKLYPTTKNMELIVPLARKHVAVTNVFNEAGKSAQADNDYNLVQALKTANSGYEFNTVLDGTNRMIPVDESKLTSGYTYEIAFSILDFEGNISTTKYYVKIK